MMLQDKLPDWAKCYFSKHELFRRATRGFSDRLLYFCVELRRSGLHEPETDKRQRVDDFLCGLPFVTPEFLDTGERFILPAIAGRQREKFLQELSYLRSLAAVQSEAWQRELERQDREFEEFKNLYHVKH